MSEFRKSAIKISQGKRTLFVTTLTVRDLMKSNFCRADVLDPETGEGMQRLLSTARARGLSKYIIGAYEKDEAVLPTAVLLATTEHIDFDERKREMHFEDSRVCPFNIVDGQHRVEGLKMAAGKNKEVLNFTVPAIIAPDMTEEEQMLQFVIVNMKQEKVGKDVADHIIARFHDMLELKDLPYIPDWLKRPIEGDNVSKTLRIIDALNKRDDSPWQGRIQLATVEKDKRKHTITQKSFASAVRKFLLVKNQPLLQITDEEAKQIGILRNYWQAVANIFVADDPLHTNIFKSAGLKFFLIALGPVVNQLARNKDYTVEAIEECILSAKEHLIGDAILIFEKTYWQKGGGAGTLNDAGIQKLAANFTDALSKTSAEEVRY